MKRASSSPGKRPGRLQGPVPSSVRVAEMAYQILLSQGSWEGHNVDLWQEAVARLRSNPLQRRTAS